MTKADRNRIKALLTEAITVLCKNGLTYKDEFAIEGLLGITLDSSEVFLVSINETIKNELAEARESLRQQEAAAAQKLSSAGQRHTASPVKQVPHSVPVSRHATHSSPGSHQKNIPQPVSVYKNSKSGQYQQIHPSATRKRSVDESSQDVEEDLELHVQAVEQGEDQELDDLNETFQTEQSDSVISRLSDSASGEPPSKRAARDESYRTDSRSPAESGDSENESKYKPEEPDIIFVKQEVTDDTDENSSASQSRTRIPQSGEDPQPGCSNWDASNNQLNINSPTSFLPTPDQQQAHVVESDTRTEVRQRDFHARFSDVLGVDCSQYNRSFVVEVQHRKRWNLANKNLEASFEKYEDTVMCQNESFGGRALDTTQESHKCIVCGAEFHRKDNLKRHIRSIHEKEEYGCPSCGLVFNRRDNLINHIKKRHESMLGPVQTE